MIIEGDGTRMLPSQLWLVVWRPGGRAGPQSLVGGRYSIKQTVSGLSPNELRLLIKPVCGEIVRGALKPSNCLPWQSLVPGHAELPPHSFRFPAT